MNTSISLRFATSLVATAILIPVIVAHAAPILKLLPEANIEMWWSDVNARGVRCLYMRNNETGKMRRICPVEGTDCWEDTGWQSFLPSGGGEKLPTYFDPNGNLYIVVGPNQGGIFSGSTIGTCLPFTANTSGTIMLPAQLVY